MNDDWTARASRRRRRTARSRSELASGRDAGAVFAVEGAEGRALAASRSKDELGVCSAPDERTGGSRRRLRQDLASSPWISRCSATAAAFRSAASCASAISWTGELRAIGDVLRDQCAVPCALRLRRVRRARRQGHQRRAARPSTNSASSYQGATDNPEPLFRRRALPASSSLPQAGRAPLYRDRSHPNCKPRLNGLDALLDSIAQRHEKVKLASSLAAEDMLLTHAILSRGVDDRHLLAEHGTPSRRNAGRA